MVKFEFAEETKDMTAAEILNYYRNLYYTEAQVTERGIVANAINDVLPNMVEVVHGRFELIEKAGVDYWRCSACQEIVAEYYYKPKYNYCPNCGAKMDLKG